MTQITTHKTAQRSRRRNRPVKPIVYGCKTLVSRLGVTGSKTAWELSSLFSWSGLTDGRGGGRGGGGGTAGGAGEGRSMSIGSPGVLHANGHENSARWRGSSSFLSSSSHSVLKPILTGYCVNILSAPRPEKTVIRATNNC